MIHLSKSFLLLAILFSISSQLYAQIENETVVPIDEKYREDQFYFGFTYNLNTAVPDDLSIRGLSGGINFGFVRDMPLNERRNVALGVGVGLALDQYGQNLFIGEDEAGNTIFSVIDESDVDIDRNRFQTAVIEAPLEFRWRSSTATSYRFWRVYGGVRVGYAFAYKSTFSQDGNTVRQTDILEFDRVRLTGTFSFGYNKINFFAAYAINPFFEDAISNQGEIDFQPLKLGFIFYIL